MEHNLKIFTDNIEEQAVNQINDLLNQEAFSKSKVRIMPDVHAGAGCVVGFTADLGDKVIPNIVGVDIGCGVYVVKFPKETNINLEELDIFIKNNIPSGFAVNNKPAIEFNFSDLYCYNELENINRLSLGIGSLGGGNHFIELDEDEEGFKYLVIHTGSRNLGLQVAKIYQNKAIESCKKDPHIEIEETINKLKSEQKYDQISKAISEIKDKYKKYNISKELSFLEGIERENYLHDMRICQVYAKLNRREIAKRITRFINIKPIDIFESVHNYIDSLNMVRKGAISAHKGEQVIIPLNMRDGSIIGIGKGNEDWNESAPHGAGRLMSRSEAKRTLQLSDFQNAMKGIYTTTVDLSTIDEAPMVYKNANEIINSIKDTVDITHLLKPIYNFKASN